MESPGCMSGFTLNGAAASWQNSQSTAAAVSRVIFFHYCRRFTPSCGNVNSTALRHTVVRGEFGYAGAETVLIRSRLDVGEGVADDAGDFAAGVGVEAA